MPTALRRRKSHLDNAESDADKQANRALARLRVKVEHGIRRLKRFRILAERYRNRRRHFTRRVHLLAGIINFELALAS